MMKNVVKIYKKRYNNHNFIYKIVKNQDQKRIRRGIVWEILFSISRSGLMSVK